jgi:dGTPase
MEWEQLLQPYRLGCPKIKSRDPGRHEFQRDYDRLIFSTSFRRLQGKTQVFPFPESDLIHTRLTHSLEASCVGRTLGTIVGLRLKGRNNSINEWELGSLVSAASLAHDIGNPPLGHSGEDAIREYFKSPNGGKIIENLSIQEKSDFTEFEGNALGFHLLTHSVKSITEATGGLALTLPLLATYCKYPRASYFPERNENAVSEKKPGLFSCDIPIYEKEIAKTLKIEKKNGEAWYRHPLAFLNEAADDICYTIIDFEDGYRHDIIKYEEIKHFFTEIALTYKKDNINNLAKIKNNHDVIGYLRSKAINSLVHQIAGIFIEREKEILNCEFDESLCESIESNPLLKEIISISQERIYSCYPVLQIETAGFKVIPGLLDLFLIALKEKSDAERIGKKCKKSSSKVLKLIPGHYILDYGKEQYNSILSIVGYIAGMTDNYAIDMYRNLSGIQLPNY